MRTKEVVLKLLADKELAGQFLSAVKQATPTKSASLGTKQKAMKVHVARSAALAR
jgi:hypothetical protein